MAIVFWNTINLVFDLGQITNFSDFSFLIYKRNKITLPCIDVQKFKFDDLSIAQE